MTKNPAARVVFIVLVTAAAVFLIAALLNQGGQPVPEDVTRTELPPAAVAEQQQQEEQCAVCGKTGPAGEMQALASEVPGEPPAYVCSDQCKQTYETNPERYQSMAQREKGEAPSPASSATGPPTSGQ